MKKSRERCVDAVVIIVSYAVRNSCLFYSLFHERKVELNLLSSREVHLHLFNFSLLRKENTKGGKEGGAREGRIRWRKWGRRKRDGQRGRDGEWEGKRREGKGEGENKKERDGERRWGKMEG